MSNFTPGPWFVDGHNTKAVIAQMNNGGWQHVCTCDYGYLRPEEFLELNQANARLIAAAPEMLRLLRQSYSLAGKYGHSILEGKIEKLINSIDND